MNFKKMVAGLSVGAMLTVAAVGGVSANEAVRLGSNWAALGHVFQTSEGFELWRYIPDGNGGGNGELYISVSYDEVADALETAEATGESVLLGEEGDLTLWAKPDGTCQMNSPMIDYPTYEFVFEC